MKIKPVFSNQIELELDNGEKFIIEAGKQNLTIRPVKIAGKQSKFELWEDTAGENSYITEAENVVITVTDSMG